MKKFTKIVATIGPATESEEMLAALMNAGMNVARFNTKHNEPDWHNDRMHRVKKVAAELGLNVAILLDLQGPEIRINLKDGVSFPVKKGDRVTFTSDYSATTPNTIMVPSHVIESLHKSNIVSIGDGSCEFLVLEEGQTQLTAEVLNNAEVKHRKTLNTPGVTLDMPSLTERDMEYLTNIEPDLAEYVGLSFVRNANDIQILKDVLKKRQMPAKIIAKIENQSAIDHLDEILEAADAAMVARGDLGVEVPFPQLIHWQKAIIEKCRLAAKPVITATEMLKSMVENPRPTRAEVSDVAHAVYDGTDAVMLSDETTIGKYPVEAVATQAMIAEYNEPFVETHLTQTVQMDASSCIAHAAYKLITNSSYQIDKIVCLTETGRTAQLMSRFRPKLPIYACTSNETTLRSMMLLYGVEPCLLELPERKLADLEDLLSQLKAKQLVREGEKILLIHGTLWKQPGLTNTLSIVEVK